MLSLVLDTLTVVDFAGLVNESWLKRERSTEGPRRVPGHTWHQKSAAAMELVDPAAKGHCFQLSLKPQPLSVTFNSGSLLLLEILLCSCWRCNGGSHSAQWQRVSWLSVL